MASNLSCSAIFTTQTPYPLPSQKFMIPVSWKRYQLSQLINKALSLVKPVPFDFLVRGELLQTTLGDWCTQHGVGEEETLEIEYIESVLPPQKVSEFPHDDWVSSVSCDIPGHFLTASYDGSIRAFDYSQNLVSTVKSHSAPVTSICVIPSGEADHGTYLIGSASHDLSAQILELSVDKDSQSGSKTLTSLHLHTAALSSIVSNGSGSHLLTSSWDGLIGLWDTTIPLQDEVPDEAIDGERRKRRKVGGDATSKPKRKAPLMVLKSHSSRVSRALFGKREHGNQNVAYSCGFDSTVRLWDIENGICTHTITASEKPFLDIAVTSNGHTALAASTDRTISLYDLRSASESSAVSSFGSLLHAATPSCVVAGSSNDHQIMSGAYDGVVRLWDLRSLNTAVMSFKAWDGKKKVLGIDWKRGIAGIGGEGGLEVWKSSEEAKATA